MMHMTIDIPDSFPKEKALKKIQEIENSLAKEAKSFESKQIKSVEITEIVDPWDNLDIERIAVDTGIEDFAENHDHYLYGYRKKT